MHWFQRHLTLKGRIILFLTAFFAALMVQMYVNHYQSNVVLDQLGRQTGNFHSISQFSSGISRQLTALENFRWENGDANALMQTLQSGSTTADTWLWRIDGDLREVGEEQYLLAQAVRTTYENYDRLMDELQTDLKRGDTEEAAALYYGEVTLCGGYLQQYTDELLQTAITEGQRTYTRLSALNERLKGVQAVTTLLCVLLGALFVRTVWHLLDPVQQMIVASRAIGRGELDTPDVIVQQTDEIGQLAGAFNTMKHSMARQVNMVREKNEIERQLHRRETEALEREALADLVARRTDGRVEVRVYSNGVLGSETSVVEQMEYGGIDFSRISIMSLGEFVPQVYVLQLPFLYENDDHMWAVLDGPIGQVFLDSIDRAIGLTGLAWFDAGLRHFYTNSPVTRLEDLQGMKIRVAESSLMEAIVLQLGADPVRIPYDDVYSALAKREIDGAENNWPSYDYTGHYEVAKYMLLDGHTRIPELMLASAEAMDKLADLDPEFPTLVRQCAKEAGLLERDLWRQTEAASEEKMRKAGVTVTTLDEEELERFRQATAPIYHMYADQKALIRRILNAAPDGE